VSVPKDGLNSGIVVLVWVLENVADPGKLAVYVMTAPDADFIKDNNATAEQT
jgi:hypothetical protein